MSLLLSFKKLKEKFGEFINNHEDYSNKKVLTVSEVKAIADKFGNIAIYEFPDTKTSFFSSDLKHELVFKLKYDVCTTTCRSTMLHYAELLPLTTNCIQTEQQLNEFVKLHTENS
jgi:hypothetical protein